MADHVLSKTPYRLEAIPEDQRIDMNRVMHLLREKGVDAALLDNVETILDHLFQGLDETHEHVIVIMSNGGFDGIYGKILQRAEEYFSKITAV